MPKVLVTGATGFIGRAVVTALLEDGYEVRALVRPRSGDNLRDSGVSLWKGDLTVPSSLRGIAEGINAVCHIAGVLGSPNVDQKTYFRLNAEGTSHLLAECLNRPIEKFIHCSTAGVMGSGGDPRRDESSEIHPGNAYECSKAEGEAHVLSFIEKHRFPAIILRPGMVYGPGDMHHLGLYRAIKKKYFFLFGSGNSCLDPVFVNDVAGAFVKVLKADGNVGETFLISGPRPVPVREFAETIALSLGHQPSFLEIPVGLARAAAFVTVACSRFLPFKPILTPARVKFLSETRSYSINKARQRLGYEPLELKEGIARTVSWYKSHGYL
ncbi:MAG: NAD-dependent epimerase/dehydratase family protein [Deltaproteobacteria bacterium]|nr:MAG: NAD-dependent epimerase/dehydratase family protein [Deltaproteobacteria bacterium]